jgi:hypothetical protein
VNDDLRLEIRIKVAGLNIERKMTTAPSKNGQGDFGGGLHNFFSTLPASGRFWNSAQPQQLHHRHNNDITTQPSQTLHS